MKVLLTVHQFLPDYSSGTEILTLSTARQLREFGHEVVIFTGHPAKYDYDDDHRFDNYLYDDFMVYRFNHAHVPMGGQKNVVEIEYNNKLVAKEFRKIVRSVKPDVVHFFHLGRLSGSLIDTCLELSVPTVYTPTDFWFICPTCQLRKFDDSACLGPDRFSTNCLLHIVHQNQPKAIYDKVKILPKSVLSLFVAACHLGMFKHTWYGPLVQAMYRRRAFLRQRLSFLNKVLAPTKLMQNLLVENGMPKSKIQYCPFGIEFEESTLKDDNKDEHSNTLRIGFIGTLYQHKGAHILVQAIKNLDKRDLELKIYGKMNDFPDYVEKLLKIAEGDERISFLGTFPNSQINEIFAGIDVLVVPSVWYENTPLVIYSAQACRCPVIATDLGGMSEVIRHGHNGLLFKKGDVSALSALIRRLIDEKDLLKQLQSNSIIPKTSEMYAKEISNVYQLLIKR